MSTFQSNFLIQNPRTVTPPTHKAKEATKGGCILIQASQNGQLASVHSMLNGSGHIGLKEINIALFYAALNGHFEIVHTLCRKGADPNRALYAAAKKGHDVISQLLLDCYGANVHHTESRGQTALHSASANGHLACVRILLSRGANVSHVCHQGYTPLLLAAGKGHNRVAKLLIEHNADPNENSGRGTPLHMASKRGFETMVHLLIAHGAKLSDQLLVAVGHIKVVEALCTAGAKTNVCTQDGTPVLHLARDPMVAKKLIEYGADVNAVDQYGRSASQVAFERHDMDLLVVLLAAGPKNDHGRNGYDKENVTPSMVDTAFLALRKNLRTLTLEYWVSQAKEEQRRHRDNDI